MSRILLLGVGPMPSPNLERVHAPGLRLRAFLDAIRLAGHTVFLAEMAFGGKAAPHAPLFEKNIQAHRRLEGERSVMAHQLESWIREFEPDAIVALTDVGGVLAGGCSFKGPIWVDFFGHPMAERQQQAHSHSNNTSLADQWLYVLPALLRADHFSVCVESQRHALLGELGAAGRLNAETCGHELVSIIPAGIPILGEQLPEQSGFLQKIGLPTGARAILSTGGFNTWVDEESLFRAVEHALTIDTDLHFVCTGGRIPGHVEVVFEQFERRIANSPVAPRCHLLGWIQHHQLVEAVTAAHVGINMDLPSIEGELGYRNRLLGWLHGGMRVVSTVVGEPARTLVQQELIRGLSFGDWRGAGEALVEEARRGRWPDITAFRRRLEKDWSWDKGLDSVRVFCAKPTSSPDRRNGGSVQNPLTELQLNMLIDRERQQGEVSVRRFARDAGNRLLGSRLFRVAAYINPRLKELAERLSNL